MIKKKPTKKVINPFIGNDEMIFPNLTFSGTEAYKMLRTNVIYSFTSDVKCPVIGVTSSIKGEGKSTTSINLAYTLAASNKKVILIEGDMRLPSIDKHLKMGGKDGLSSILTGVKRSSESVIVTDKTYPNLSFILAGPIPPNPSELLGAKSMAKVVELLKEAYDYIILDLPPVTLVSDPIIASKYVDGMIVVTRQDYGDKRAFKKTIQQLEFAETKIIGVVYRGIKDAESKYGRNAHKYKYYQ